MSAINISDLCYDNDGIAVVHCAKYKDARENDNLIMYWVFGSLGALIGCLILIAAAETAHDKWKSLYGKPQPLTPQDDAQFKELSMA